VSRSRSCVAARPPRRRGGALPRETAGGERAPPDTALIRTPLYTRYLS
jgi:hypothetical protein